MGVSRRGGRGSQVPEINGLLEKSCGGRRGSGHVVASGHRDGGGVRRPGRCQNTVDGEQRRADGRRLGHGRGTGGVIGGTDQLRGLSLGVAVTRLLRRRHQAAFVRYRGRGGHRLRQWWRPFRAVAVIAQARGAAEHAVASQSPV